MFDEIEAIVPGTARLYTCDGSHRDETFWRMSFPLSMQEPSPGHPVDAAACLRKHEVGRPFGIQVGFERGQVLRVKEEPI